LSPNLLVTERSLPIWDLLTLRSACTATLFVLGFIAHEVPGMDALVSRVRVTLESCALLNVTSRVLTPLLRSERRSERSVTLTTKRLVFASKY
jgi:hypothetical protein